MQWVMGLDYEVGTEKLTAATESAVFIIDTHVSEVLEPYSDAIKLKFSLYTETYASTGHLLH